MPPSVQGRPGAKGVTRRRFLAGIALGGIGGPCYMRFIEPRWLEVSRHPIPIGLAPAQPPLRILHLSDLHASPEVSLEFIRKAVWAGLGFEPDLVCLTGDFITRRLRDFDRYVEVLQALAAKAPTFACLGNHDGGAWARAIGGYDDTTEVRRLLRQSRVEALHNASACVRLGGRQIWVVGLGDLWAGECAPAQAFSGQPPADALTIVLAHNPDSKEELVSYRWQLMLSGHTHGGQLRLPWLGTPLAPVEDKRFVQGAHPWNRRWLHVTKGIGNVYGLRFNCRPEISLLTLT
jgi:uncharacterized protein